MTAKEKNREKQKRWRERNPDKLKQYRKDNACKFQKYNQKCRDKKKRKLIEDAFIRQSSELLQRQADCQLKKEKYKEIFATSVA